MKEELNNQELQKTAGGWYGSMDDPTYKYCPKCGKVTVKYRDKTCPNCGSPLSERSR